MSCPNTRQLAVIILKTRFGIASEAEKELLLAWLDAHDKNPGIYRRVVRGEALRDYYRNEDEMTRVVDVEKVVGELLAKTDRHPAVYHRRRGWLAGAVAACLLGAVIIAAVIRYPGNVPDQPLLLTEEISEQESPVKLIVPSGKEYRLDDALSFKQQTQHRMPGAVFSAADSLVAELFFCEPGERRIVLGTGAHYHLTLPDGTKVWMNARSELAFPDYFSGGERRVKMKGELYFEVTPDPARPFVVEAGGVETLVLGTAFNVKAYEDEMEVCVTLVSGRVQVKAEEVRQPLELSPGMATRWQPGVSQLTGYAVAAANTVAWRNGHYIFEDCDIEEIMRVLSRWYGVRFLWEGGDAGMLTGRINMDEPIGKILESITLAGGPVFEIDGTTIHVCSK